MKLIEMNGKAKILSAALIIVLCLLLMAPPYLNSAEADCELGLAKCSLAALLLAIGGNPVAAAAMEVLCLLGYLWCLEFMA
ncbi:MAG: hypothetical protein QHH14_13865 [Clostridiales bacterium]|nr:hypothetical protein [Clostridiales bacterium]